MKRIKADWPEGKGQLSREVNPLTRKQFIAGQSQRVGKFTLNGYRRVLRDAFKLAVEGKIIAVLGVLKGDNSFVKAMQIAVIIIAFPHFATRTQRYFRRTKSLPEVEPGISVFFYPGMRKAISSIYARAFLRFHIMDPVH